VAQAYAEGVRVTWWRSRYVQHLEAENAELREQIKRMLNPQWRYLLFGEQVPAVDAVQKRPAAQNSEGPPPERQNVKIPRYSWRDFAAKAEYLMSPQYLTDKKKAEREAHLASSQEN
jgi:hypothetical protein